MAVQAMLTRISILILLFAAIACGAPDFHELIQSGKASLGKADYPAAERLFLEACDPAGGPFSADMNGSCEHHLAIVSEARGDLVQAETRLLKALAAWEKAGREFLPSYAMTAMDLGEVYRKEHRPADAERYLLRALDLAREVSEAYPQIYPEALSRLGGAYAAADNATKGKQLVAEGIDAFRRLSQPQPAEEARAFNTLGIVDLLESHETQAITHLGEAVQLSVGAIGENHPDTAAYQSDLALAYIRARQFDRAEPLLNRARFVLESQPVPNRLRLGTIMAELSMVACAHNKLAQAEEFGDRATAILGTLPEQDHAAGLLARVNIAASFLAQHRLAPAERILPATVEAERQIAPDSCLLADGLRILALLRAQQHSWREALDMYRESLDIYEREMGPGSPAIVPLLRDYADAVRHSGGSKTEAKRIDARARAISGYLPPA